MKLKIEITMDNAAFEDGEGNGAESARILERLAKEINDYTLHPGPGGDLRDINGNKVGTWKVTR